MNQICFMFRITKSLFTLFSSRLIIMSWAWSEGSPISRQPIWACVTYFSLSQDYEFQKSIFSASLAWLVLRSVWATTMNSGPRRWTDHGSACKDRRPQLFFPSTTSQISPAHPRQRGYTMPGVTTHAGPADLPHLSLCQTYFHCRDPR